MQGHDVGVSGPCFGPSWPPKSTSWPCNGPANGPAVWCTGDSDYAETMRQRSRFIAVLACLSPVVPATAFPLTNSLAAPKPQTARIDHVADGDTFTLRNGERVRIHR